MSTPTEARGLAAEPAAQPTVAAAATSARGGDGKRLAVGDWAYFEGQVVPFTEATVSVATHAFNYGTAIFEGIRAYRQASGGLALLFGLEHFRRFLRNGRLLRATVPETAERLVEVTCELLRRNAHDEDTYIRPLLYKSAQSIRLQLSGLDDRITIFTFPLGDYVPTEGLRVSFSAWQRVNDNAVPARGKISGSYVNACLAVEDAKAGGYAEALLLGADGHVSEASSANLFVVGDGGIATPPLSDDVLPGITRGAIIALARDLGHRVEERPIDRTELYTADEVFLSGTGVQIAAVASIDDRPVGEPGAGFPVTSSLQAAYFRAVRGLDRRYSAWLTPVEGV
ncbi:MAG: branched-chain amino acid transaminase [Chloroflexota bacterium]|nr:branched-chain amino acid transaminase [Chloroflexota bacterium]